MTGVPTRQVTERLGEEPMVESGSNDAHMPPSGVSAVADGIAHDWLIDVDLGLSASFDSMLPVLADVYLHQTFDAWMAREFYGLPFERHGEAVVVHCRTESQARFVLGEIETWTADRNFELNEGNATILNRKDPRLVPISRTSKDGSDRRAHR
jgi:hypothetical protein